MSRITFLTHKGARILQVDFSGLQTADDALRTIAEAKETIAREPTGSVRTLTDVAGSHFDLTVSKALWEYLRHNRKFVMASAIVGVDSGQRKDLFDLLTHQTRREVEMFDDAGAAKDWLAEQ